MGPWGRTCAVRVWDDCFGGCDSTDYPRGTRGVAASRLGGIRRRSFPARRDDLDEVPVGVLDEREALHAARVRRLLELAAEALEALAGLVDVRHSNPQVPEAALDGLAVLDARRVRVARVVDRACGRTKSVERQVAATPRLWTFGRDAALPSSIRPLAPRRERRTRRRRARRETGRRRAARPPRRPDPPSRGSTSIRCSPASSCKSPSARPRPPAPAGADRPRRDVFDHFYVVFKDGATP